jgi:type 2 lantibiotic biosynthesis protein LanM
MEDRRQPAAAWLADLVARAATLAERAGGTVRLEPDPRLAGPRRRRWRDTVARGDETLFAARLALDGLSEADLDRVLGRPVAGDRLPGWAVLIADALVHTADGDLDADRSLPPADEPAVAGQAVVVAVVRAARTRLDAALDGMDGLDGASAVGPAVLPALERELLGRLAALAGHVLDVEFRTWRRPRLDRLAEAVLRAGGDPPRGLYDAWVAQLRTGGLADLLDRYPVLARTLGVVASGWVEATAELLQRSVADAPVLAATFAGGEPLGALVAAGGISSDPHRGQRRVVPVTFASGRRLVYKPKSLRTEVVQGRLLTWLNERGARPPLRVPRVLDLGDHGWVEFVGQREAADEAEVARFYRRAGTLLAVLYALGANDCHADNVVADGGDPVVIDAETILHPTLQSPDTDLAEDPDAQHVGDQLVGSSVLAVGLLPAWRIGPGGAALDVSGLGGTEPQPGVDPVPTWEHRNTDVARIVLEREVVPPNRNVLRCRGAVQHAEDHVEEISAGFRDGYGLLLAGRDELLAADGPLAALEQAPVRVLFRGTPIYERQLSRAMLPARLGDGAEHSLELELLGRPLLDGADPGAFWGLHRLEQAQLEAADIPYFSVPGGADALRDAAGRPLAPFRASPLAAARARLAQLSPADRDRQLTLVRASLATRRPNVAHLPAAAVGSAGGPDAALAAALVLGTELADTAIRSGSSAAWMGLTLADESQRWRLGVTGYDLYEGGPGIAVFLAALARATAEDRWRELARAALEPTLLEAERQPGRLALLHGAGGAAGFGGTAYALVLAAGLLGDDRPLAAALALAGALPVARLRGDVVPDLLSGTAGALLGLLAVDRAAGGDPATLDTACSVGRLVAAAARELPDGSVAWRTAGGRWLDGMAHGTAGVALAVGRLGARTGDRELVALAGRALLGESRRFDAGRGGWPDRRDPAGPLMTGWCHGAAGIGLSRLELLDLPLDDAAREAAGTDLDRARAAVLGSAPAQDQLCCGLAGELELLTELGRRGDQEAARAAEVRADALAGRILAGQPPRLNRPDAGTEVPSPSLLQGTSGVGLALLRRARPGPPAVLAWR